jgi:basic membrane protein A
MPKNQRSTGRRTKGRICILLLFLGLVSCTQAGCTSDEVTCAALVTSTAGLEDHGVNQDAWNGLEESKTGGALDHIAHIESVDARDYAKNIAYFAEGGYDLIITTGTGMADETFQAAKLYPDIVFLGLEQPHELGRPNLIPITFAEDQMGYLAGALATRLTETRVVGAVCETSGIPSIWRYCEGFRAGVEAAADEAGVEIKVLMEYRDDGLQEKLFIDEAWGAERARNLIQRGADVIFAAGGATGQGALRAASDAGIYSIGTERDQAAVLEESRLSVVTSIYGRAGHEVQSVIRQFREGKLDVPVGSQFGYVPLDEKLPQNLSVEMDELLSLLLNGYVQTNITLEKP